MRWKHHSRHPAFVCVVMIVSIRGLRAMNDEYLIFIPFFLLLAWAWAPRKKVHVLLLLLCTCTTPLSSQVFTIAGGAWKINQNIPMPTTIPEFVMKYFGFHRCAVDRWMDGWMMCMWIVGGWMVAVTDASVMESLKFICKYQIFEMHMRIRNVGRLLYSTYRRELGKKSNTCHGWVHGGDDGSSSTPAWLAAIHSSAIWNNENKFTSSMTFFLFLSFPVFWWIGISEYLNMPYFKLFSISS